MKTILSMPTAKKMLLSVLKMIAICVAKTKRVIYRFASYLFIVMFAVLHLVGGRNVTQEDFVLCYFATTFCELYKRTGKSFIAVLFRKRDVHISKCSCPEKS